MPIRIIIVLLLSLSLSAVYAQSQPVPAPPLAFSTTDYSNTDYYLYDVISQTTTQKERSGSYGMNETGGFSVPPPIVNLRAPQAYFGRLVLIDESDPESDGAVEGGYTLYFLNDMYWQRVGRGFSIFNSANQWSPDERYLYLQTNNDAFEPFQFLRFEPETGNRDLLLEQITRVECQWYTRHCLLIQQADREDENGKLIYLDKLTGEINIIYEGRLPQYGRIQWHGTSSRATFSVLADNGETTVYQVDAEQVSLTSLLTVTQPTTIRATYLSPDGTQMLAQMIHNNDSDDHREEFRIYDLQTPDSEPLSLDTVFDRITSDGQFPPEWITDAVIGLEGSVAGEEYSFYTFDITTQQAQRVNAITRRIYDMAWSPDGRWFAYVTQSNELYVVSTEPDSEPILVAEDIFCVAWESAEIMNSGKAHLCDKHWGMG